MLDHRTDQRVGAHSFAVVREDGDVGHVDRVHRREDARTLELRRPRRRVLVVDAHDLLPLADDAQLLRRVPIRRTHDAAAVHLAQLGEAAEELRARLVLPAETDEVHVHVERGEVRRHVRRAARHRTLGAGAHHGHGRLGRDPVHLAVQVAVEHQVADDGDVHVLERIDVLVHRTGVPPASAVASRAWRNDRALASEAANIRW